MYLITCAAVFGLAYLVNTTMISVFYHRGPTHNAVELSPGSRRFAAHQGIWLTGLDAKGWIRVHRRLVGLARGESYEQSPSVSRVGTEARP